MTKTKLPDWLKPDPKNDDCVIGTNGHRYPSRYYPGIGGNDCDDAWEILDSLRPDAIPMDVRCLLAGQIAGLLARRRNEG